MEPDSTDVQRQTKPASAGGGVSWTLVNFWLDAALLVIFLVHLWLTALLRFVFPAGPEGFQARLWGWELIAWQDASFITTCLLAAAVTLHVMLHWTWICGVINKQLAGRTIIKRDGSETLIGVGLLAAILHLLALGVLLARWAIIPLPD